MVANKERENRLLPDALRRCAAACLLSLTGCALPGLLGSVPVPNPQPIGVAWHAIPADDRMEVFYGILAHSNGKVYVGTCYHTAKIHEFNPSTGEFRIVAQMTSHALDNGGPDLANPTLLGDLGTNQWPETRWVRGQDKIHGLLHEGADGRVYGSTHVKVEDPNLTWNYPGGHWFANDPKTETTEDLGWSRRHEGIIASCMDRRRNILYGVTWPTGYLVRCKPDEEGRGKRLQLLELVSSQLDCATRYLEVTEDGRVYVPDGATGAIRVYDPARERLFRVPGFSGPTKEMKPVSDTPVLRDTGWWRNWWMTGTRSPDGMHIYYTSQRSDHLVEIDATRPPYGAIVDHGRIVPWGSTTNWGGSHCGLMVFGSDGLLYHNAKEQLLSFNPETGEVLDWGKTVLASDPEISVSLDARGSRGPDGTIYAIAKIDREFGLVVLDAGRLKEWQPKRLRVSPRRIIPAGGAPGVPY